MRQMLLKRKMNSRQRSVITSVTALLLQGSMYGSLSCNCCIRHAFSLSLAISGQSGSQILSRWRTWELRDGAGVQLCCFSSFPLGVQQQLHNSPWWHFRPAALPYLENGSSSWIWEGHVSIRLLRLELIKTLYWSLKLGKAAWLAARAYS